MASPLDLPALPEITVEDFMRAWTRFELVATAKEWNEAKTEVDTANLAPWEIG